jgi:hypothetical protein
MARNWRLWTTLVCVVETSGQSPATALPAPRIWRWNVVRRDSHPRNGATPAAIRRRTGPPPSSGASGWTHEHEWCSCGPLPATLGSSCRYVPRRLVDWPYLGWVGLGSTDPISTPPFLKHLSFTPQGMLQMGWADTGGWGEGKGVHVPAGPTRRARWKY